MEKAHILVVEDSDVMAKAISDSLESLGYIVSATVSSGEAAIQRLAEAKPDLILMDISLAGEMDGVETADQIHSRFQTPIVFLTVHADEPTLRRAKVTGPFGYVLKPFKIDELHATIEMALYKDQLERRLRASRERLQTLFEGIPIGLYRTTPEGQIVDANSALVEMLGYPDKPSLLKVNATDVFTMPEERGREQALLEQRGVLRGFETQARRFDGSIIWLRDTARAIVDSEGVVVYYEGALEDVTERKRSEEAMARHNRELALLNRAGQAFNATLDLDHVLASVLEEVRLLLDVVACSVWLIESPPAVAPIPGSAERASTEQDQALVCLHVIGPQSETVRGWRLDLGQGLAGWVARHGKSLIVPDARADERHYGGVDEETGIGIRSILIVPLRGPQGVIGVLEVVDTAADRFDTSDLALIEPLAASAASAIVNARLHRELQDYAEQLELRVRERTAEIQTQYARLKGILDNTTDGIVVTDRDGEIIETNVVAQIWLTHTLSTEDATQLEGTVRELGQRVCAAPTPESRAEAVLELEGLDLEVTAAAISGPGLEEVGAVVNIHNVSELKSIDRMKTRFVTNISHELRTPITTISLYSHLMKQQPKKYEEHLDSLIREADHQARLVEDIMEIARIDAGRLEISPHPTPLNELAEAVVARHQVLAHEQDLTLELRLAEPGPVAWIDPKRITQAANNLVDNAIRYTPAGGKVVVFTGEQVAVGKLWAKVTVADTGIGIPADELPHVFERFFRGEESRAMQLTGTGLRLTVSKEIVDLHGGRVTVASKEGLGSAFTIWLPLAD